MRTEIYVPEHSISIIAYQLFHLHGASIKLSANKNKPFLKIMFQLKMLLNINYKTK